MRWRDFFLSFVFFITRASEWNKSALAFVMVMRVARRMWSGDSGGRLYMSRARAICAGMIIALLVLMMVGCELGVGGRAAPTPMPPATPLPPSAPSVGAVSADQKLVAGNLHVEYIPPCALRGAPAEWVAPIRLTDLRSGSVVYLNRNGSLSPNPSKILTW